MSQAIAGVSPESISERTVMVVWPSNSAYWPGRLLGRGYALKGPFRNNKILWLGNLVALATIPVALAIYFWRILPFGIGMRYRLTNRRIIVERGATWKEEKSLELDKFDAIDIDVRPGQEWYHAGDLVFRKGETVVFRLEGVGYPEAFRTTLMKSNRAYVGVKQASG